MSLEDIPSAFADFVGCNEGVAQIIISIAVIFTILLPTMLLSRGKNAIMIWLIMTLFALVLLVGLGWIPFWILIMTIAMMALAIATLGADTVTGGS